MNEHNSNNKTDTALEAEFVERNGNIKKSWNNIIDKIDEGMHNLEVPENIIGSSDPSTMSVEDQSDAFRSNSSGYYGGILKAGTSREQDRRQHGWGYNLMDAKLMHSVNADIHAMHSTDAEEFGIVANKFEETFGGNALM